MSRLLPVTAQHMGDWRGGEGLRLLIMQHALKDTAEFVRLARNSGIEIGRFVAKPNSIDSQPDGLTTIEGMGIEIVREPAGTFPSYSILEGSGMLDATLEIELADAQNAGRQLAIIDVGGYFCEPIRKLQDVAGLLGVVEVTTRGHDRYVAHSENFPVPVMSIARSPLKNAEAVHVGDGVVQATEDILREVGILLHGKTCGVIGFGMIGSRITQSLLDRNLNVSIADISPSAAIQARITGIPTFPLTRILGESAILFSATARQSVKLETLKVARDGILLVSGGSKADEFDIVGIRKAAISSEGLSEHLTKYRLPWGKSCVVANDGKAVNFLKGGSPEEVMDIVFAEQFECVRHLAESNQPPRPVSELPATKRDKIAENWLKSQEDDTPALFKS